MIHTFLRKEEKSKLNLPPKRIKINRGFYNRGIYIDECNILFLKIKNLTYHLKELEKEEKTKPKVSRRKEIIKIGEEINKIEIQKITKKKSTKPRAGSLRR